MAIGPQVWGVLGGGDGLGQADASLKRTGKPEAKPTATCSPPRRTAFKLSHQNVWLSQSL